MFAISTSDYAISRGDRSPSPLASDEQILIFEKNQINKRRIIEEELQKIPDNERNNLTILMKCLYSNYVEQLIYVKLVKNNEKYDMLNKLNNDLETFQEKFEEYSTKVDASVYPEIWKSFDYTPFINYNGSTNINNYKQSNKSNVNKIYLFVPFSEKENAKKLDAKWDNYKKKWYIFNNNKNKDLILQKWKVCEI